MSSFEILMIIAVVVLSIVWFWAMIDCAMRKHPTDLDKLVWVAIMLGTWVFGALAYLFVWRSRTTAAS